MSNLYQYMTAVTSFNKTGDTPPAYEATVSLAAEGQSAAIIIPNGVRDVMVTVTPGGGATASVQTSTDTLYVVKESTTTWTNWGAGLVAATTTGVSYPVTAIRLNQAGAGTSKLMVKAQ